MGEETANDETLLISEATFEPAASSENVNDTEVPSSSSANPLLDFEMPEVDIYSIDMPSLLMTLDQLENNIVQISPTNIPKWASTPSIIPRIESVEEKLQELRNEICTEGISSNSIISRCENKSITDLIDQLSSMRVILDSEINLLSSGVNRCDKIIRSRPTISNLMSQVYLAFEANLQTKQIIHNLSRVVTIEAEEFFWDLVETLSERLKGNEDYSVVSINKIVAKLDKQANEIEKLRTTVEDSVKVVATETALQTETLESCSGVVEDQGTYEDTLQAEIEMLVERTTFQLESFNENFIEFRDGVNERIEGMEEIMQTTDEEFEINKHEEKERLTNMKALYKDIDDFLLMLKTKNQDYNKEFPLERDDKQSFMDELKHEQVDSRSSNDKYIQKCKEIDLSQKSYDRDIALKALKQQYFDDEATVNERNEVLNKCSEILAHQIEIMEAFPEQTNNLAVSTQSLSGEIVLVRDAMTSLEATCKHTIEQVDELQSIRDEAETLRATVIDRETRVKRVRAELSAIEQSSDDNSKLLIEINNEINNQEKTAQNSLSSLREELTILLTKKQKEVDNKIYSIQKELDVAVNNEERGGGADGAGGKVGAVGHGDNATIQPIVFDVEAAATRQEELEGQAHAHAEMIGLLCIEYQKSCQLQNTIPFLSPKTSELCTISCMVSSDLIAESTDIEVMHRLAASPENHMDAMSITIIRNTKIEQFIQDVLEYVDGYYMNMRKNNNDINDKEEHEPSLNEDGSFNNHFHNNEPIKHEDEISPEDLKKIPKCIACDRPMMNIDTNKTSLVDDTIVIKRGNFPSFGNSSLNQGEEMIARLQGGDVEHTNSQARLRKIQMNKKKSLQSLIYKQKQQESAPDEAYVLKSGFKFPQIQN